VTHGAGLFEHRESRNTGVVSVLVGRRSLLAAGAGVLVSTAACGTTTRGADVAAATTSASATAEPWTSSRPPATAPSTPTSGPTPSGLDRGDLEAAIADYLGGRVGSYAVAVHDRRSGVVVSHGSSPREMLSTVKVLIAVAVLREVEQQARWLTAEEDDLVAAMIQRSDNDATEVLTARLGQDSVEEELEELRMHETTYRPDGAWWGWSTTTPEDLLLLVDHLVDGTTGLTEKSEEYLLTLMEGVTWAQRWGVATPPLPSTLTVRTKNGWGPMADGYRTNSLGHVVGEGRDHSMAVLGRSPLGFSYGTTTVSRLAQIVNDALEERLV
jgi:hypothetical protein